MKPLTASTAEDSPRSKEAASQSTALSHRGPGVYIHPVDTGIGKYAVYVGKSDHDVGKRTRAHNDEAAYENNKKLLPRARRQFGENNHHARILVAVPDANNIKNEIGTEDMTTEYPAAALVNTINSLVSCGGLTGSSLRGV